MACTTNKYGLLFHIILLSLMSGINGQISVNINDVPDDIHAMLTNITASAMETANSQVQIEGMLGQMVSALNQNVDTQNQLKDAQTQVAGAVAQMVNLLQMHSDQLRNITAAVNHMAGRLDAQSEIVSRLPANDPIDCSDLASRGRYQSGAYKIRSWDNLGSFSVYCDMDEDGNDGGWTVLQRRFDGSVDFYLGWDAYVAGFGSPDAEYWMGLSQIHRLTRQGSWRLQIELTDFDGNSSYAEYDSFAVGDAESFYRLSVGAYSGTAGDSLTSWHNDQPFSTKDRDHDAFDDDSCARTYQGAWWYRSCYSSNLNGLYFGAKHADNRAMVWYHWKNSTESLKRSVMKIQRRRI